MRTMRLPLARGYVKGIHLVIPECPLCGMKHTHGSVSRGHYKQGDLTTRSPHCLPSCAYQDYVIEIVDDVGDFGKVPGVSKRRNPKKMPAPEMVDIPVSMWGAR